ncbi:MAG: SIMPL domain-containing protein [Rickettsiales bacterium]|jgi:uncharacterized protein YggE|nr:SIMPL domain-containing protein [Rickettsiales bacterium]
MKLLKLNINHAFIIITLLFSSVTNAFAVQKILEVSASKTLSFKTTEAIISFDIIGRGPDTDTSYQDYATKSLNIITHLRSESDEVKELQTTSFLSNPVYNYESKNREIIGFDTISTVSFKVSSELVAIYLNFLSENNIDRIHNIEFSVPDQILEEMKEEAVKHAIDKALLKADNVLRQLNLKRKAVIKIELDTSDIKYPKFEYQVRHKSKNLTAKPHIIPKEQEIMASVTLHIAY